MNILGKRYIFVFISLLIIVPGLVLAAMGLPLAIDFTGGSLIEVSFDSGETPAPADVKAMLSELGIKDALVQPTNQNTLIARFSFMDEIDEATRAKVVSGEAFAEAFNQTVTVLRYDSVGPTVGKEVAGRAALAVGIAAVVVVLFIAFAFRGLSNAFRYGICAIIAMVHDVAIVISLGAIGGKFFGWQIDALFLTALLTVIGFSVQDKIVVFDRIRENSTIYRRLPFETLVNHSIIQTLQRSINTQLMTVEFMLLAMALFGGITLRPFAVILLVGLFSGTYSSIFIASTSLVIWENQEWKQWFKRGGKNAAASA
jgi:preprotein translocase subunit SecF